MPDRSESINADSLNSNFLQLGRRSGGRPQRTVYPRRLPVNTVIHTYVSRHRTHRTFRLLVRRDTSIGLPRLTRDYATNIMKASDRPVRRNISPLDRVTVACILDRTILPSAELFLPSGWRTRRQVLSPASEAISSSSSSSSLSSYSLSLISSSLTATAHCFDTSHSRLQCRRC